MAQALHSSLLSNLSYYPLLQASRTTGKMLRKNCIYLFTFLYSWEESPPCWIACFEQANIWRERNLSSVVGIKPRALCMLTHARQACNSQHDKHHTVEQCVSVCLSQSPISSLWISLKFLLLKSHYEILMSQIVYPLIYSRIKDPNVTTMSANLARVPHSSPKVIFFSK